MPQSCRSAFTCGKTPGRLSSPGWEWAARFASSYLTESIIRFAGRSDVLFASHHWPTWGRAELTRLLGEQRDLSVSHNVKAIYQRHMGWFDGNPHICGSIRRPRRRSAMSNMGGSERVLCKARASFDEGDFRWVAQVLDYVIFAQPDNVEAKSLQADTPEQLSYGAENGTWRNFYLTGALELREGSIGTPTTTNAPDIVAALGVDQLFDALALRIDGPRAWAAHLTIDWNVIGADPTAAC